MLINVSYQVTPCRSLSGPENQRLNLDWPTRKKICIGIARGLTYLHEESRLKIVHRDIKATNVLLDKDLNAKISDFGLAKLDEEENTHISTRIAGTVLVFLPSFNSNAVCDTIGKYEVTSSISQNKICMEGMIIFC